MPCRPSTLVRTSGTGPQVGRGADRPGTADRARMHRTRSWGWPVTLALGYVLFHALFLAEMACSLPRGQNPDCLGQHAVWFVRSLALAPIRAFCAGPCQRFPQLGTWLLACTSLLLGIGYLGALRAVQRQPERGSFARLLGWAGAAAIPLLLVLPHTSVDYLLYLFGGRVAAVYHQSPWGHALAEFPAEMSYLSPRIWGPDIQFIYGPASGLITALLAGTGQLVAPGKITPESFLVNVVLIRFANILAVVAAGRAVWRINGRLWPGQQRLVTAAFLLNPLLIYEAVGAMHNDIWGVMFLLWAFDLFLRDDARFAVPLTLSILVKYMAFALTPILCLYYARRRDWRRLATTVAAVLVSLVVTRMVCSDYVMGHIIGRGRDLGTSPTAFPQFLVHLLTMAAPVPDRDGLMRSLSGGLSILFAPIYAAFVWRARTREQVIESSLWAITVYLVVVYVQSMQWYFICPLGLLCAVRWTRGRANLAWASWAVLLGYVRYFWSHNRCTSPSVVVGFLLAIGLPAALYLAGRQGWWRALPLAPAAEADPAPRPRERAAARSGGKRAARARPTPASPRA
jgi:hypothetical protein